MRSPTFLGSTSSVSAAASRSAREKSTCFAPGLNRAAKTFSITELYIMPFAGVFADVPLAFEGTLGFFAIRVVDLPGCRVNCAPSRGDNRGAYAEMSRRLPHVELRQAFRTKRAAGSGLRRRGT